VAKTERERTESNGKSKKTESNNAKKRPDKPNQKGETMNRKTA